MKLSYLGLYTIKACHTCLRTSTLLITTPIRSSSRRGRRKSRRRDDLEISRMRSLHKWSHNSKMAVFFFRSYISPVINYINEYFLFLFNYIFYYGEKKRREKNEEEGSPKDIISAWLMCVKFKTLIYLSNSLSVCLSTNSLKYKHTKHECNVIFLRKYDLGEELTYRRSTFFTLFTSTLPRVFREIHFPHQYSSFLSADHYYL